jgi:hypothetical protein
MPPNPIANFINAEAIVVGLEELRRTLEDEEQRGRHLDSKGFQILGFAGVIFTLTATLGASALSAGYLGADRSAAGYLFVVSLAFLVGAALAAVNAVRPTASYALDEDELERFGYEPRIYEPAWKLRGDILLGLAKPLREARRKHDRKAQWVTWATRLVGLALLVVAAEAAIVGFHAAGVLVTDKPKTEPPSAQPKPSPEGKAPDSSTPFEPVGSRIVTSGNKNKDGNVRGR